MTECNTYFVPKLFSRKLLGEEHFVLPCGMRETRLLDSDSIFALGLTRLQLQGHGKGPRQRSWSKLFDAATDGFSFENVHRAIIGYSGPTLIIVLTAEGSVLGAFTSTEWRDGAAFFGDSDAMLFALKPELRLASAASSTYACRNYMYLNTKFGHEATSPRGIGFGGVLPEGAVGSTAKSKGGGGVSGGTRDKREGFRLWLDESMPAGCYVQRDGTTFESGEVSFISLTDTKFNTSQMKDRFK